MQGTPKRYRFAGAALLVITSLICLALVLFWGFRTFIIDVEPDERGVVISPYQPSGLRKEILGPGRHMVFFGERVQIYDMSPHTYTMSGPDSIRAKTLDGKTVLVDVSIRYTVDPNKVIELHITWQNRYEDSLVRPQARAITREVISAYKMDEIHSQLAQIEQSISDKLERELDKNYLTLLQLTVITVQQSQ